MNDATKKLLDSITERYNAEVNRKYSSGELDFIPTDNTPEEMLQIIIAEYALNNFPDILS